MEPSTLDQENAQVVTAEHVSSIAALLEELGGARIVSGYADPGFCSEPELRAAFARVFVTAFFEAAKLG